MDSWKRNPKAAGSGLVTCIPQTGECPNDCDDCFFQSGRSYLEPLEKNLPHIPDPEWVNKLGYVVRMNDGNDSNVERELVERVSHQYDRVFFNTAIPCQLGAFPGPVVLTVNRGGMIDKECYMLNHIPPNLMFVRFRANTWNTELLDECVWYYTSRDVPVVITWMAYFTTPIPNEHRLDYIYSKRTINSYWCVSVVAKHRVESGYENNPLVYTCGYKTTHSCKRCGNCLREYHNTMVRLRGCEDDNEDAETL